MPVNIKKTILNLLASVKRNRIQYGFYVVALCLLLGGIVSQHQIDFIQASIAMDLDLYHRLVSNRNYFRSSIINKSTPERSKWVLINIENESRSRCWRPYAIHLHQLQNNLVMASFSQIDFDNLVCGLEELSDQFSIQVKSINIRRIGNTPYVKVESIF